MATRGGWLSAFVGSALVVGFLLTGAFAASCIALPPSLPDPAPHRPTILHDAVYPPANEILTAWPADDSFRIPVQVDDNGEQITWDVLYDFDPITNVSQTPGSFPPTVIDAGTYGLDAGVFVIPVQLSQPPPTSCHRIEFLVSHAFASEPDGAVLLHKPDAIGGDEVTWFYAPPGTTFDKCTGYDAGPYEDGAFPPQDAMPDTLPVVADL